MTWLAFKAVIKKIWLRVKKYWKVITLVLYTIFMWLLFQNKTNEALEVYEATKKSYQDQIDVINKSHEEELRSRDEIITKYNEIIDALEKQYLENREILNKNKKKEIKDLVEKYKDDPRGLAKELSDKFGFIYVGGEDP